MIGVGIVTFRRPAYYERCAASIVEHLSPHIGWAGAVHDGPISDPYPSMLAMRSTPERAGVGTVKNHLIREMLIAGCDWIVLCEDDVEVLSPNAVLGYIAACEQSGFAHLNFAHHGYVDLIETVGPISYYRNYCGAWSVTSATAIRTVGWLDDGFDNSMEHVEWTLRLAAHGFTSGWRRSADATGSDLWLREQPDARENSTISNDPGQGVKDERNRAYWKRTHPETARLLWPA